MTIPIHSNHSIHDFLDHQINQAVFTDTEVLTLYDATLYNSTSLIGRITDGTKIEKLNIEVVSNGIISSELDVTRTAIGTPMSLTFTLGVLNNFITLIVGNTVIIDTNTLRYYLISANL